MALRENSNMNSEDNDAIPIMAPPVVPGMAGMSTGMLDDFGMDYGQANYEVFDPLNWMLDGIVDFPYSKSYSPFDTASRALTQDRFQPGHRHHGCWTW